MMRTRLDVSTQVSGKCNHAADSLISCAKRMPVLACPRFLARCSSRGVGWWPLKHLIGLWRCKAVSKVMLRAIFVGGSHMSWQHAVVYIQYIYIYILDLPTASRNVVRALVLNDFMDVQTNGSLVVAKTQYVK